MEEQIVETYLKAKREQRKVDVMVGLSMAFLATLIWLNTAGIDHDYTSLLAGLSMTLMLGSVGGAAWVKVSRQQLVATLGAPLIGTLKALKFWRPKIVHNTQ